MLLPPCPLLHAVLSARHDVLRATVLRELCRTLHHLLRRSVRGELCGPVHNSVRRDVHHLRHARLLQLMLSIRSSRPSTGGLFNRLFRAPPSTCHRSVALDLLTVFALLILADELFGEAGSERECVSRGATPPRPTQDRPFSSGRRRGEGRLSESQAHRCSRRGHLADFAPCAPGSGTCAGAFASTPRCRAGNSPCRHEENLDRTVSVVERRFVHLDYPSIATHHPAALAAPRAVGVIEPRQWLQSRTWTLTVDLIALATPDSARPRSR